ncbi:MAG: hypothetical protein PHQ12_12390 [Chthoniobacteraceae bacterium]|nr:hypothetical protein [Chthoniobacteraceae bacterium]
MNTEIIHSQPSWRFASDKVEAAVAQRGGHLAPVRFHTENGIIEPYAIAPWAEEKTPQALPQMLKTLRGDFFCAPFGGNETAYRGESHPPHGESANGAWSFEALKEDAAACTLHLSLATRVRAGRVDKFIQLRKGHTALYCRDILSGMSGKMDFGHHAILRFPEEPGSGTVSTSRILYGQVYPGVFENPEQGGYSSLKAGAEFKRLDRVPAAVGGFADVSRYPARRGFEDLLMAVHEARPDFAWTAVTFPRQRYAWFALKDPRVLRSTVLWLSNGGRHYAPWSGRHTGIMGLEDVTAYFHYGIAQSARPNPVSKRGFPTSLSLRPAHPLTVNYIMAVAAIPRGFDRVKNILPGAGWVELQSAAGPRVRVPLDTAFLQAHGV